MTKFEFATAAADVEHKTGFFGLIEAADQVNTGCCASCDVAVDWYTRRNGSNERVIRVTWYAKPVCRVKEYRGGFWGWTKKRKICERSELFPFTAEGLALAESFAKKVAAITFFERQ